MNSAEQNNRLSFDAILRRIAIALLCIVGLLFLAIFLFTKPAFIPGFSLSNTGEIGDTIGGISAPIVGLFGVAVTFLAFWVQYIANQEHADQFDKQSIRQEADKHRDKILYLIKQNRNIAENMSVQGHVGPKCFKKMFDEYKSTYLLIKKYCDKKNKKSFQVSNQEIINAAYMIFYNGVGPSSNSLNKEVLKNFPYYRWLIAIFSCINRSKSPSGLLSFNGKYLKYIEDHDLGDIHISLNKLGYRPFEGHVNRLGQYFRNLYHILDYTSNVDSKFLTDDEKYELIKSLRSQLSNYEQIFIHFNSLSCYGDPMRSNRYIARYKLVKNIPLPLIGFVGDIRDFYLDGNGMKIFEFEWDQIIKRTGNY